MGQVFLKKKQQINEDDIAVSDPNIASRIAELNKQLNDAEKIFNAAEKQYNDKRNQIKNQILQLQKQDITQNKAKSNSVQSNQVQNTADNQQNQNNGQAYNESVDYIFRKAIRLSKKLYEEKKAIGSLGREFKKELDELDLSYTMSSDQCKKLARKVEDVLDDNFDKENSSNKWPTIEKEIKKYFKRAEDVNYSNAEKGQVLKVIKDILKEKPEYDWVFGNENKELEKEIKDAVE